MQDIVYKHRQNDDWSWDSICPHCALIIARVDHESQLSIHEHLHICDPAIVRKPEPVNFRVFLTRVTYPARRTRAA